MKGVKVYTQMLTDSSFSCQNRQNPKSVCCVTQIDLDISVLQWSDKRGNVQKNQFHTYWRVYRMDEGMQCDMNPERSKGRKAECQYQFDADAAGREERRKISERND